MFDPGVPFKATTLMAAWRLITKPGTDPEPGNGVHQGPSPEASDAIEEIAARAGMRSRRVLLGGAGGREAGGAMGGGGAQRRPLSPGCGGLAGPSPPAGP